MAKAVSLLVLALLIIGISGCTSPDSAVVKLGWGQRHTEPAPYKHPPRHAPAHGRRAQVVYHYYPAAEVYFNPDNGVYFYLGSNGWTSSISVSYEFKARLGSHVSLSLDTDRPYIHHREHTRKYPPGHTKKNHARNKGQGKGNGKGRPW